MGYFKSTVIYDGVVKEALDDLECALVEIDRLKQEKEELLKKWASKVAQLTRERNYYMQQCRVCTTSSLPKE